MRKVYLMLVLLVAGHLSVFAGPVVPSIKTLAMNTSSVEIPSTHSPSQKMSLESPAKKGVNKTVVASTKKPHQGATRGGKIIYAYDESYLYEVHTGLDRITDIELQPGEQLVNQPMAGDTVRWKVGITKSGNGTQEITHVVIKPLEPYLETNLLITTNKHIYRLQLFSHSNWYMPAIAWHYPQEEMELNMALLQENTLKEQMVEPLSTPIDNLNFDYEITGDDVAFKPVRVFDNEKKTYLQMPAKMQSHEAPALFILEEGEAPLLANYRVKGSYYIIDRLFEKAELRVGDKQSITIHRGKESFFKDDLWSGFRGRQ